MRLVEKIFSFLYSKMGVYIQIHVCTFSRLFFNVIKTKNYLTNFFGDSRGTRMYRRQFRYRIWHTSSTISSSSEAVPEVFWLLHWLWICIWERIHCKKIRLKRGGRIPFIRTTPQKVLRVLQKMILVVLDCGTLETIDLQKL